MFAKSCTCFADINKWDWTNLDPVYVGFNPSCREGLNRKNRDCARSRYAVASPFLARVLTCIREEIAPLPHRFVHGCRVNGCGHVPPPFPPPLLVRWFYWFDTLFTRLMHCLEPIELRVVLRASLGEALITYLCWLVKLAPRPPQLLLPCAGWPVFPRNILYLPILRILASPL